jgi:hypothetical protein
VHVHKRGALLNDRASVRSVLHRHNSHGHLTLAASFLPDHLIPEGVILENGSCTLPSVLGQSLIYALIISLRKYGHLLLPRGLHGLLEGHPLLSDSQVVVALRGTIY